MHDAYQKDDIYNEAARRVGAGDIVLGKRTIRKNIEFTLHEIRKVKIKRLFYHQYFYLRIIFGAIFYTHTRTEKILTHIYGVQLFHFPFFTSDLCI